MTKIILCGCNGYMGRVVTEIAASDPAVSIIAGIDVNPEKLGNYPVFASSAELMSDDIATKADVIVDFSIPAAIDGLLELGVSKNLPLVLCATGYSAEQLSNVENASTQIPIFRSANMSLGINLLVDLIKRACAVLGEDFDIEIVERHHRRKIDAPSGTALLLADAAASALPHKPEYTYERKSKHEPRSAHEIGISAVRGGTIVGEHEVIFAGQDEVIELCHTAASRDIFAAGAIRAAKFVACKSPVMYDMSDVLG